MHELWKEENRENGRGQHPDSITIYIVDKSSRAEFECWVNDKVTYFKSLKAANRWWDKQLEGAGCSGEEDLRGLTGGSPVPGLPAGRRHVRPHREYS